MKPVAPVTIEVVVVVIISTHCCKRLHAASVEEGAIQARLCGEIPTFVER
jgi:hypothetical protein